MSDIAKYNEYEMAIYLFPFYSNIEKDGINQCCEKVESELKEWVNSRVNEQIELMKRCFNCKNALVSWKFGTVECAVDARLPGDHIEKSKIKELPPHGKCDNWEMK